MMKRSTRVIASLLALIMLFSVPAPALAGIDSPITIRVMNGSLAETIAGIAAMAHMPFVIIGDKRASDVSVSIEVTNLPFYRTMQILQRSAGTFRYSVEDGMLTVTTGEVKALTNSYTFTVNYANLTSVKDQLSTFLEAAKIVVNPETRSVTIDATPANADKARELIERIDVKTKQVTIMVRVAELGRDVTDNLGTKFTWNSYNSATAGWRFAHTDTLEANSVLEGSKIVTRPSIMTHSGTKATIEIGDRVPVPQVTVNNGVQQTSFDYKDIGIRLQVTPHINPGEEGYVTMDLVPEVTTITKYVTSGTLSAPQMSTRKANTTVRVAHGETLILGGLLKEEDIETITKIPGLGDLPFLGKLFTHNKSGRNKRELAILITPIIEGFSRPDKQVLPEPVKDPLPDMAQGKPPVAKKVAFKKDEAPPAKSEGTPPGKTDDTAVTPTETVVDPNAPKTAEEVLATGFMRLDKSQDQPEYTDKSKAVDLGSAKETDLVKEAEPVKKTKAKKKSKAKETTSEPKDAKEAKEAQPAKESKDTATAPAQDGKATAAKDTKTTSAPYNKNGAYDDFLYGFATQKVKGVQEKPPAGIDVHLEAVVMLLKTVNDAFGKDKGKLVLGDVFSGKTDELARYNLALYLAQNGYDAAKVKDVFTRIDTRNAEVNTVYDSVRNLPASPTAEAMAGAVDAVLGKK